MKYSQNQDLELFGSVDPDLARLRQTSWRRDQCQITYGGTSLQIRNL